MKDAREPETARLDFGGLEFKAWACPSGIRRLELPSLGKKNNASVKARVEFIDSSVDEGTARHIEALAGFLSDLLAGKRPADAPPVDLEGVTPFTRKVLGAVERIPWGSVASYGEVAAMAGSRGSARAAGGAVARNPVPLVIPCHRVVRAGGGIGGWSGAPGWKERLLELEGSMPRC